MTDLLSLSLEELQFQLALWSLAAQGTPDRAMVAAVVRDRIAERIAELTPAPEPTAQVAATDTETNMGTAALFDAALAAGRVELEARRGYLAALAARDNFATFDEYRTARTAAREAMRAAQDSARAALEAYHAAERTEHARIVADLAARDGFLATADGPSTSCKNTIVHAAAPEASHAEDAIAHGALGRTFDLVTEDDTRAGLATWAQLRASLATHEGWIDVNGTRCYAAGDVRDLRAALAAHDEVVGLFGVEVAS